MSKTFLSVGECMVEMSDAGGGLYRRGFAGDTFNTAWYARRLLPDTWRVGYVSAIGDDAASAEMAAFMQGEGIDISTLRRFPDRTVGLYMISLEQGERSFSYWRGQSAARGLADDPTWLAEALSGGDILYFSGITLAILTPAARQTLCDALRQARTNGAQVAFDTNLRPRLWESKTTMQDGMHLGASVADVVLPSFDEETILFDDASPADTITRYRKCGAEIVAVKNGPADLTLWDGGQEQTVSALPIGKVVDTTAAGDSFGAAFLTELAQGRSPTDAAQGAMALAAKVIQSRGALVPEIFKGET